jgi:hypothetical protein
VKKIALLTLAALSGSFLTSPALSQSSSNNNNSVGKFIEHPHLGPWRINWGIGYTFGKFQKGSIGGTAITSSGFEKHPDIKLNIHRGNFFTGVQFSNKNADNRSVHVHVGAYSQIGKQPVLFTATIGTRKEMLNSTSFKQTTLAGSMSTPISHHTYLTAYLGIFETTAGSNNGEAPFISVQAKHVFRLPLPILLKAGAMLGDSNINNAKTQGFGGSISTMFPVGKFFLSTGVSSNDTYIDGTHLKNTDFNIGFSNNPSSAPSSYLFS